MKGQWVGSYKGTNGITEGLIVVNVDERSSHYQGVAYLNPTNLALPRTAAFFKTPNKDKNFAFHTDLLLPINPLSGEPVPWKDVKDHFPQVVTFSNRAEVTGSWGDDSLTLSWTTDVGVTGTCVLPRSTAHKPSELVPLEKDWETYKKYVATLEPRRYLFRGQNEPWRLRTSFHREGRFDLTRFLNEDIQELRRHLSSRTKHVFNLNLPDENGAFFNLVQHHGYPTPLLDWTYSPYVAAFFAYRGIPSEAAAEAGQGDKVRVFVFDQARWRADFQQPLQLVTPWLYLSIGEFLAIENERMIPQQAASTVTNVDDVESYIRDKESEAKKYLWAIDLPVRERKLVVCELGVMGITAGSLFPGLDGACEELRERNFEI